MVKWMHVALYADTQKEEDAEEAGHGRVAHCCRFTGRAGVQAGGCRAARFTQGDGAGGVGRRNKCQKKRVLEG